MSKHSISMFLGSVEHPRISIFPSHLFAEHTLQSISSKVSISKTLLSEEMAGSEFCRLLKKANHQIELQKALRKRLLDAKKCRR